MFVTKYFRIYLFSILLLTEIVNSARILMVVPTPSLSHHLFFRPIIKELISRGHHVTSIAADPIKDPQLANLTEIDVHDMAYNTLNINEYFVESFQKDTTKMQKVLTNNHKIVNLLDGLLSTPKVKEIIGNPKENFDLVMVEVMYYPVLVGFKKRFKCPIIGLKSLEVSLDVLDAIGNSPNPSYYIGVSGSNGHNLSFQERLENSELLRKHFNSTQDLWTLQTKMDLILANTSPVLNIPKPQVPNYIQIGGLHAPKRGPLTNDLKNFLDGSKQGALYFSLGSNVKTQNLPMKLKNIFVKAVEELPYSILCKWQNIASPNIPKNVFTAAWFPQQDILDHPNLKVFVSHAGLHSIEESIRSKVPMVVIPFGGDHDYNARRVVALGIGRLLRYKDLTLESLLEAIDDVANNPKYKQNISKVASYIWDQQTKPLDRAIWWIEYVLRHGGAQHLRCPAADLPWYKYLLLDVVGFILGILLLSMVLLAFLISRITKYLCSERSYKRKQE